MLVEEAVEGGAFGVAGAVDGGAVAEEEGAEREASEAGGGGRRVGEQRGCENAVHGASIEALWRCPSQRCAKGAMGNREGGAARERGSAGRREE